MSPPASGPNLSTVPRRSALPFRRNTFSPLRADGLNARAPRVREAGYELRFPAVSVCRRPDRGAAGSHPAGHGDLSNLSGTAPQTAQSGSASEGQWRVSAPRPASQRENGPTVELGLGPMDESLGDRADGPDTDPHAAGGRLSKPGEFLGAISPPGSGGLLHLLYAHQKALGGAVDCSNPGIAALLLSENEKKPKGRRLRKSDARCHGTAGQVTARRAYLALCHRAAGPGNG